MNENQVGVILEEVRDMFKTLAEGQKVIENRMDRIEGDVTIIKSYVIRVDETLNDHEQRITELEQKVAL